jgi:hypothetical protein
MFMKVLYPGIEDIGEAMLSKVAEGEDPIYFCEFVLLVQPDVS